MTLIMAINTIEIPYIKYRLNTRSSASLYIMVDRRLNYFLTRFSGRKRASNGIILQRFRSRVIFSKVTMTKRMVILQVALVH